MFKVDNKDTRTTPLVSFQCLYCYLWTYFTPCCVYFVDFEEVNADWVSSEASAGPALFLFIPRCAKPSGNGKMFFFGTTNMKWVTHRARKFFLLPKKVLVKYKDFVFRVFSEEVLLSISSNCQKMIAEKQ